MSELREELLATKIDKKRIIGIVLVAVLLISVFSFSVVAFSFLFGSQRPLPSKEKANTDYESVELVIPPFPFNWFEDIMDFLSPEQLAELLENISPEDLAAILDQISDGVVENFDLSDFPTALLALLAAGAGEIEVFRIYNYLDLNEMSDVLWKYECFDNYDSNEWTSSAFQTIYPLYSPLDYYDYYFPDPELLKVKMDISPEIGSNSMIIPSLFPIPFIMEGSINAYDLDYDKITLLKDNFNSSFLDLTFFSDLSEYGVNMTYELFGLNLPSNDDVNNSAIEVTSPTSEYSDLLYQFTQLPPDVETYIDTWANFRTHYNALDSIIEDNDNAFVIANKIRNYLQTQFSFPLTPDDYQSAPEGQDSVDWFCEQGKGIWSDFASAFCVFTRAFGVASRFVDGYRTRAFDLISQTFDVEEIYDSEEGQNTILIKLKNLYNWAEIYVPTDIYGNGMWVQMDVNLDTYGDGGGPPLPTSFNITVNSNFTEGYRNQVANLTATLSSPTNLSVENREITFTDYTYGIELGKVTTNQNGTASLLVDIDTSQIVGPHLIGASYLSAVNFTYYTIFGDIDVNLVSVSPTEVNRSITNTTNIQGYVYDPIANQSVKDATVEFLLFQKGTNNKIGSPFDIIYTNTDNNGDFNELVNVNSWVPKGKYEIRVDFNGSWSGWPWVWGIINDSSNRIEFNITEESTYNLLFYINNIEAYNYESPSVTRYSTLKLKVILTNETGDPVQGEIVEFYDYSRSIFIGSNTTNVNGETRLDYYIDSSAAGPNLLYVKCGKLTNYSYFILNAPISINLNVWPLNREISKGPTDRNFYIQGYLNDTDNSKPIKYGEISFHMFDGPTEIYNWIWESGSFESNEYGEIFTEFSVDSFINTKNYTLEVWFNGTFYYPSPIPHTFNLLAYTNFSSFANADYQLKVYDPSEVIIIFKIEGNHRSLSYNDGNPPATYTPGQIANFEVWINQSDDYAPAGSIVRLRDTYTNDILGSPYTFDGTENGYYQFNIDTSSPLLHAGLHYIEVEYENVGIYPYNSTYIIINETVSISYILNDYIILRDNDLFTISGTVSESLEDLKGLQVEIVLLDASSSDVSFYLNLFSPKTQFINDAGDYSFSSRIFLNCSHGEYNLLINFTGRIQHTDGPLSITISNPYMISSSSSLIPINITAGTVIIQEGYHTTPHDINDGLWWEGDTLFVYGNLTWDNGTAMVNMKVNVTVQKLNGELIVFNEVFTDQWGGFNASFLIDEAWSEVNYVDETKIVVYFDPEVNNLEYVEETELQFT